MDVLATRPRARSRTALIGLGLAGVLVAVIAACGSASSTPGAAQAELQHKADLYDIDQIEVIWHKAASTKDIPLMMSLWADNATFTVGTKTYTGKQEIQDFIATAKPFQASNVWESDTPAYKIVETVDGDAGTLYFECHYIDVATKTVAVVVGANQDVARIDGKWLITKSIVANPVLAP